MIDGATLLSQFHFLRPWWLLAIPTVLLLGWWLKRGQSSGGRWREVISPELVQFLVERDTRGANLRPWVLAGGLIACIALAGPTWSKKPMPAHEREQALVVLFDLSPSMLAEDLTPDRLTRARLKAIDLLRGYDEGSAALVSYAGDAHVVTPLTTDTNTLISQLPVLHPDIMPVAGSNPEAALERGLKLAMNAGYLTGDLLLITDGITRDARANLEATLSRFPDFRLSVLGVGTSDGAPIPLDEQGFARNRHGEIVIAKLRPALLQGLAQDSGGAYSTITSSDEDIRTLLDPIRSRTTDRSRELERQLDVWRDQGYWLVLILLPLAALLFRRGTLVALALVPLFWSPPSQAGLWQDLWLTPDQQGKRALDAERMDEARQHFRDPAWRGIAAARAGDHEAAAEAFSQLDSATAHYNRGNALTRAGKLEEALDAYDQALERDPDMADARHNRRLAASMLEQREQSSGQNRDGEQPQPQGGDSPGSEAPQDSGGGDSEAGDRDSQKPGGENRQPPERGETDSKEENANPGGDSSAPGDSEGSRQGNESDDARTPSDPAPETPTAGAPDDPQRDDSEGRPAPGPLPEGESGEPDEPNDSAAGTDDTMSPEEAQNARQWLRRVPDDPGGLLRRKFEYESRRRFRDEGDELRGPPDRHEEERW